MTLDFHIITGNVFAQLLDPTDAHVQRMLDVLKYYDPVKSYALGSTYFETLYNVQKRIFPAGLIDRVETEAVKSGGSVTVQQVRPCPAGPEHDANLDWLKPFQREAVAACWEATRGIVKAPPGAGKTEVMIGLMRSIPCRWLVLANSGDVIRQGANRYHLRTGDTAGVVADGRVDIPAHCSVVFATFQSVYAALAYAKKAHVDVYADRFRSALTHKDRRISVAALVTWADGLIVDEVQTAAASTYTAVIQKCAHAYWRFGFSATPMDRSDNRSMVNEGLFGPIIHNVPIETLIASGDVAKPTIRMIRVDHPKDDLPGVQITDEYRAKIEKNKLRNAAIVEVATRAAKPCLLFVRHKSQLKWLSEKLGAKGLRIEYAVGATSPKDRTRIAKALNDGELDVVVATRVFYAGLDIPRLRSIIQGGAGKAVSDAIQQLGRGARNPVLEDGTRKGTFEMWDFYDEDAGRMRRHSVGRIAAYRKAGFPTEVIDATALAAALPKQRVGASEP